MRDIFKFRPHPAPAHWRLKAGAGIHKSSGNFDGQGAVKPSFAGVGVKGDKIQRIPREVTRIQGLRFARGDQSALFIPIAA